MRKVGKYEKMRKNALLSSYITSILCLVLCVTMFFGTTAAWFTDTTTNEGNQIYVGKLAVELKFAEAVAGKVSNDYKNVEEENVKVFGEDTFWEPGRTIVRKFELTELGDLAFGYQLGVECAIETETDKKIAEAISVWNYTGKNAKELVDLPVNFEEMEAGNWEKVGTLYDVITNKMQVFSGKMDREIVTATKLENEKTVADPAKAYHLIALNMDKKFEDVSVQGQTLDNITIKLVATQMANENDAFGDDYDMICDVVVTPQTIAETLRAAEPGDVIGLAAGNYAPIVIPVNDLTLVSKKAVVDNIDLNAKYGTVIDGLTFNTSATVESGNYRTSITDKSEVGAAAAHNITIKNCTFEGAGDVSKYVPINLEHGSRSNSGSYNITVDGCTFKCNAFNFVRMDYMESGIIKFTNNVFGGASYTTGHHAINMSGNASDVVIMGNSFTNWKAEKTAFATGRHTGFADIVDIKVVGNTFSNTDAVMADTSDGVIEVKTNSYNSSNCKVIFAENIFADGLAGKTEETIKHVKP